MPSWYTVAAICISGLALLIAAKNYLRKAGVLVRGGFSISSSRDCDDQYVSHILIENLKDRAITIFSIYLRVGHNFYIHVEDFEESPLILKAYETFQKQYGPIQFYGLNASKVSLNSLLSDQKIRKRLVLSTSDGKYVVPSRIKHWNPVGDFFRNHLTATLRPVRLTHKGKHIGANIRYVIEFIPHEGKPEIVPIHPRDFELKMFKTFSLTREALESCDTLKAYLRAVSDAGLLKCRDFEVHDVGAWQTQALDFYSGRTIQARYYSFFEYHLFGRVSTWMSERRLKRKNESLRLAQQAQSEKLQADRKEP